MASLNDEEFMHNLDENTFISDLLVNHAEENIEIILEDVQKE